MLIGRKLSQWVGDFETTTDPDDCRVWGWGLCSIDNPDYLEIGTDLVSFIDRISTGNTHIYFHNLAFDGSFIIDWLLRQGFMYVKDSPAEKQFTALISNMGKFYSIAVVWENSNRTEFRDSFKKIPMGVSRVASSFKLDEMKGSIDYHAPRPVGHVITPEERKYIENDVQIVARALRTQFDSGMTKLTVGSDALAEYKRLTGSKLFTKMFPILPDSMDKEIRQAYRGGWTISDERFRARILGVGKVYDVNSLYPSIMYDRVLPYGEPIYCEALPEITEERPLFIVSITFTAKLKPNHVPIIQVKGHLFLSATEYQTNIDEPVTMSCTNVDLEMWEKHYDMEILAYNGGWSFKGVAGLFVKYIDKWMEIKINSSGGMREIAKLHLNSLYGKFATNPNVTGKIPSLDPKKNILKLTTGPEETRSPVYTAMGAFITAYARNVTISAAQDNYDIFAYADTDSLHLLTDTDPDNLDVDPDKLGAWKCEGGFVSAYYMRAKAYCEVMTDGTTSTHIAGLPEYTTERLTLEDVAKGGKIAYTLDADGKKKPVRLSPKRVPGGIVLTDVGFTLK